MKYPLKGQLKFFVLLIKNYAIYIMEQRFSLFNLTKNYNKPIEIDLTNNKLL